VKRETPRVEDERFIAIRNVSRRYRQGDNLVTALDHLDLEIPRFDFVAVTGESGSGKSTLLHLLGGLDRPDEGEIVVDGVPLAQASDRELTDYRLRRLGIVFQFFNLLPMLDVFENVALPLELQKLKRSEVKGRVEAVLELVGMQRRSRHFTHQLSGGEMQRTAIARALVHQPSLILADEPTGNLDSDNGAKVLEIFERIYHEQLGTLVVVTHSAEVAASAARIVRLHNGRLHRALSVEG
jgi:ABC-type lipoprotein export system ATPase subunit